MVKVVCTRSTGGHVTMPLGVDSLLLGFRDRPESLFRGWYWYFGLIDTEVPWLLASYVECADSLPWRLADVTSGRFGHRDPDVLTVVFLW